MFDEVQPISSGINECPNPILPGEPKPIFGGERTSEAAVWLRDMLKDGTVPATVIAESAEAAGITPQTLWRAKIVVGVRSIKSIIWLGPWCWKLRKPIKPEITT